MPELPEVETIATFLQEKLLGEQLIDVSYLSDNSRVSNNISVLIGARITKVFRRAKYLIFCTDYMSLIFHLGMTGRVMFFNNRNFDEKFKHDHLVLFFSNDSLIKFNDIRKFGFIKLVSDWQQELALLGIEPLSEEFDCQILKNIFSNINRPIKPLLLDQKFIVGIGNIYASEILFSAKILPHRIASGLNDSDCYNLYNAIVDVLNLAIVNGGTTIRNYVSSDGLEGSFQNYLKVYSRNGQKCFNCFSEIEKIIQCNRSTFYCPHCQS